MSDLNFHPRKGEPSDAQVQEVATAIHNVPAAPGAERENNLTWDEAKWYARTALRAAGAVAGEPEWEYARVYYDEGGNPQVRKVQKSDIDAHRPDGHRSDGSPYWNYTPHRRRKAGAWAPIEQNGA
ncbi:hypothetical protein [Microbacterium sp. WCS2018Hpa-9]|uniref:hypothetical protein n=1 Tax=Microbacterium sp. WCS2018Hpa-9 TaxID=3073635 RepID=UPI00288A3DDE|nr:hypothetical protein [Microbacterium sp. WCS2018Hpa-9]